MGVRDSKTPPTTQGRNSILRSEHNDTDRFDHEIGEEEERSTCKQKELYKKMIENNHQ